MSAVLMEERAVFMLPSLPHLRWRNLVAAGVAVALHGLVLAVLLANWVTETPPAPSVRTISMQLMTLPAPVVPVALPAPVEPPPAPPVVPEPAPVEPRIEQQKLEQAALARKRVEERKVEQERQRVEQQRREEQERERHEHERREHARQQAQREQERVQREEQLRQQAAAQAAREAEAAAAASRQYLPIAKEAPTYPQRALDKGIEGTCTVSYRVNAKGRVEDPEVVGDCHPLFIRPSLTAAKSFRYQPRVIDGQAVAVPNVKNTFNYRIE